MKFSVAYGTYESLLRTLHAFNAEDALDSPQADETREQMDAAWRELSESERLLLRGLSADLYSLTNEEIVRGDAFLNETLLLQAAQREYDVGDWFSLLDTLRALSDKLSRAMVAYMRGRCWREIGRPEPALWFFELAHQLDPAQPNYELLVLDAMFQSSRKPEAIAKARALLKSPEARPYVVIGAAKVVSEMASQLSEGQAAEFYTDIINSLPDSLDRLAKEWTLDLVSSLLLAGHLCLAIAYERLGEMGQARRTYDQVIASFPGQDEIVVARAMFLFVVDEVNAWRDLKELVARRTSNVYPYFFLAHRALKEEHYERCMELCDLVLRNATHSLLRAHALEWTAISIYEKGASIESAKELLREAVYLEPLNENIRKNLEVAEKLEKQARSPLSDFALSQPIMPSDVTRNIQRRLTFEPPRQRA
jgi:tetratricopeptide (TPR) repeat protein